MPTKIIVNGIEATSNVQVRKPYKTDPNFNYDKEINRVLAERLKKSK